VATKSYPLEALRGERARDARDKTIDLAGAIAGANDAEARAVAAAARADRAAAALRDLIASGARASAIALADRHASLMRRRTALARAESSRAAALVAAAQGSLTDARGRAKIVDNHHDRWRTDDARTRDRNSDD